MLFILVSSGFVLGAKLLKGDLVCRVAARIVIAFGIIASTLIIATMLGLSNDASVGGWILVFAWVFTPLVACGGAIIAGIVHIIVCVFMPQDKNYNKTPQN